MNRSLENALYRWLPALTVGAVALVGGAILFAEIVIVPKVKAEQQPYLQRLRNPLIVDFKPLQESARRTLEEVAQVVTALDGNTQVQDAVAAIAARSDTIKEVWVADEAGKIVYFGKNKPITSNIEALVPQAVWDLLEGIPADALGRQQRLAVFLAAALRSPNKTVDSFKRMQEAHLKYIQTDQWEKGKEYTYQGWEDFDFDRQTPTDDQLRRWLTAHRLDETRTVFTEVKRIQGGMIGVVVRDPGYVPGSPLSFPVSSYRPLLDKIQIFVLIALMLYWFSIPPWVALDARRRGERALVWSTFALLGNMMALVLYLLVRRPLAARAE